MISAARSDCRCAWSTRRPARSFPIPVRHASLEKIVVLAEIGEIGEIGEIEAVTDVTAIVVRDAIAAIAIIAGRAAIVTGNEVRGVKVIATASTARVDKKAAVSLNSRPPS